MRTFKREQRYFVAKVRDVNEALTDQERQELQRLCAKVDDYRIAKAKSPLVCVCVEDDWPIYDAVWALVEAFWLDREHGEADEPRWSRVEALAGLRMMIQSGGHAPHAHAALHQAVLALSEQLVTLVDLRSFINMIDTHNKCNYAVDDNLVAAATRARIILGDQVPPDAVTYPCAVCRTVLLSRSEVDEGFDTCSGCAPRGGKQ